MNKTLYCKTIHELPDAKIIKSIPRGSQLKVVFESIIQTEINSIKQKWEIEYPDFLIWNPDHQCIFLSKLITDIEIEAHQAFFLKCAQDYKQLATQLINEFAQNKKLIIHEEYPMLTLNPSETNGYKQDGEMNDWHYSFHGFHCAFTHQKSTQYIEVPLMFGLEFGVLDPFFFSEYIKSTKYPSKQVHIVK